MTHCWVSWGQHHWKLLLTVAVILVLSSPIGILCIRYKLADLRWQQLLREVRAAGLPDSAEAAYNILSDSTDLTLNKYVKYELYPETQAVANAVKKVKAWYTSSKVDSGRLGENYFMVKTIAELPRLPESFRQLAANLPAGKKYVIHHSPRYLIDSIEYKQFEQVFRAMALDIFFGTRPPTPDYTGVTAEFAAMSRLFIAITPIAAFDDNEYSNLFDTLSRTAKTILELPELPENAAADMKQSLESLLAHHSIETMLLNRYIDILLPDSMGIKYNLIDPDSFYSIEMQMYMAKITGKEKLLRIEQLTLAFKYIQELRQDRAGLLQHMEQIDASQDRDLDLRMLMRKYQNRLETLNALLRTAVARSQPSDSR